MKNRRNYYRILQVQPDAPLEVIRASFRSMMKDLALHPDLGGSTSMAALINEAYQVVSNPARRAAYDRLLRGRFTQEELSGRIAPRHSDGNDACPFCRNPLPPPVHRTESCPICQSPIDPKAAKLPIAQRRAVPRIAKQGRISYCTSWPQEPSVAEMTDLSTRGMRFHCREKLDPGAILKISAANFHASAKVENIRAVSDKGHEGYSIGVSFIAVRFEEPKGTFLSTRA